jgi:hypothetical protein
MKSIRDCFYKEKLARKRFQKVAEKKHARNSPEAGCCVGMTRALKEAVTDRRKTFQKASLW